MHFAFWRELYALHLNWHQPLIKGIMSFWASLRGGLDSNMAITFTILQRTHGWWPVEIGLQIHEVSWRILLPNLVVDYLALFEEIRVGTHLDLGQLHLHALGLCCAPLWSSRGIESVKKNNNIGHRSRCPTWFYRLHFRTTKKMCTHLLLHPT